MFEISLPSELQACPRGSCVYGVFTIGRGRLQGRSDVSGDGTISGFSFAPSSASLPGVWLAKRCRANGTGPSHVLLRTQAPRRIALSPFTTQRHRRHPEDAGAADTSLVRGSDIQNSLKRAPESGLVQWINPHHRGIYKNNTICNGNAENPAWPGDGQDGFPNCG